MVEDQQGKLNQSQSGIPGLRMQIPTLRISRRSYLTEPRFSEIQRHKTQTHTLWQYRLWYLVCLIVCLFDCTFSCGYECGGLKGESSILNLL